MQVTLNQFNTPSNVRILNDLLCKEAAIDLTG